MLGLRAPTFDGGFLIYEIMTYKIYDDENNSIEVYKNYGKEKIIIQFDGYNFNSIELDNEDVEDLIFILNKLINKKDFLWKQS